MNFTPCAFYVINKMCAHRVKSVFRDNRQNVILPFVKLSSSERKFHENELAKTRGRKRKNECCEAQIKPFLGPVKIKLLFFVPNVAFLRMFH